MHAIERAVHRVGTNARVLDMGCGSGLLSMYAARAGAQHVVACDLSETVLSLAFVCECIVCPEFVCVCGLYGLHTCLCTHA
jgi:predicted RNA methylase